MDSDDGEFNGSSSTDTLSQFLRVLQARNLEESAALTGSLARQSIGVDTLTPSGDAGTASQTLDEAMKTMIEERQAQKINLAENYDENGVSVYSPEVEVHVIPTSGNIAEKSSGSNKVKITTVVNHVWELKYYHGNLVDVHKDAIYVAYVLTGKNGGNVRVISRKSAHRVLLKSFTGAVVDIAFALSDEVCLAAADESGNVMVYSFIMDGENIVSSLVLNIRLEHNNLESDRSLTRVIWCPYMPEDSNEDGPSPSKMLVLLHGSQAEVWNIGIVNSGSGNESISSKSINKGVMCIDPYEETMSVVNAAFAPDGSAVAVAYISGIVKFFLVDLDGEGTDTECMHHWNPHDGHPVTSLYFLDDHKHPGPDLQLWKFALTGALHNTEIKLWSCESWACMQTINFRAPLIQPDLKLRFKSQIDLTSKYLALSDINSRILYVLQIYQKHDSSTVHVSSLSQFPLAQPCLSFAIFEAGVKKFHHSAHDSHLDEVTTGELDLNHDEEEEFEGREDRNGTDVDRKMTTGVQIKMYGVHTKTLQELLIRYRPETSAPLLHAASFGSTSQEDGGQHNMLSDVSIDQSEASQDLSASLPNTTQGLITPMDFISSSPKVSHINDTKNNENLLSNSSSSSFTHVTPLKEDLISFHSPRSSVMLSPSSNFTQTPAQSRPSPSTNVSLSEVPLPPVTSSEEAELLTPRGTTTAGSGVLNDSLSLNTSVRSNQEVLEEIFGGVSSHTKTDLGISMDAASSTGSFPVVGHRDVYNDQDDRYDEDDKEVAEALGLEKEEENESIEEIVPLEEQEERKELRWPEPPEVFTDPKRMVNEDLKQSNNQEDEEKEDFYDDENDEAEVEEIIQCNDEDDIDDENVCVHDYSKRSPRSSDVGQASIHALSSIDASIIRLAEQLQDQREIMKQMQAELNRQREIQLKLHRHQIEQEQLQQMAAQQPSFEKDISKLEDILVSRMEHSLAQHMQRETQRLQDSLKVSDNQRKQRDDLLHTGMMNEIARVARDTVSNVIRTEIKQTVTPALQKFVDPMKEKIHQEVAHRLTACDTLLKDNIAKAVKSRSTMDVLATSVGDVIYQQMQQAYTDTFKTAMLPSFKSIMEKTVRDVHGIFQQGTKEYQLYISQNMDQMLRERVATETIVGRMEAAEQKFIQNVGQVKNMMVNSVKEELRGQVSQAVLGIKDEIVNDVRKVIKEELNTAMKEHDANISDKLSNYLRSGAATPVPLTLEEESSKDRIIRELRMGRVNDAFQCALSAGNLDLVVFTCESALHLDIFSTNPCSLTQPVLLSLISQLSANLDKNFDLKMKYLEEAVVNLDPSQSMTGDHIPRVLGGLVQKLRAADGRGVDAKKSRAIKMLILASSALLT